MFSYASSFVTLHAIFFLAWGGVFVACGRALRGCRDIQRVLRFLSPILLGGLLSIALESLVAGCPLWLRFGLLHQDWANNVSHSLPGFGLFTLNLSFVIGVWLYLRKVMVVNRGGLVPSHPVEARLSPLLDYLPEAVLVFGRRGEILGGNGAACRLLGYDKAELSHLGVKDIGVEPSSQHIDAIWSRAALGESRQFQATWWRKDGLAVEVDVVLMPAVDAGFGGVVALAQLIGAAHEPELVGVGDVHGDLKNQDDFATVFNLLPDGVFICRGGRVEWVNEAGLRLLGEDAVTNLVGRPLRQFVHPGSRETLQEFWDKLPEQRGRISIRLLHANGRAFDAVMTAASSANHDGVSVVVIRDVLAVARANADAVGQAKRLNSILDTAVDAIVVSDENGLIEIFNRSAETMFGYAAGEAIGHDFTMLLSEADLSAHRDNIRLYMQTQPPQAIGLGQDVVARRKDGSTFPAEISLSVCELDSRSLFTAVIRDVTERRNFENHLAHSATHDDLTGLPNRRLLDDKLQQAVEFAAANGRRLAVWFVDLDGFKTVNDVMGHKAGDELLIAAGQRMVEKMGPSVVVARFGGDEFALVVPMPAGKEQVARAAAEFLTVLAQPYILRGREVMLTANIGISLYPDHTEDASELVGDAGAAMIVAKSVGRNVFRFFDPAMHRRSSEWLTVVNELRRAIERDELVLHYQPQVDVRSGEIVGLEALVRWHHPTMGIISPGRFIPVAEQTGLIVPLGEWVVRQACRDLRKLEKMGSGALRVAVNISPRQFSDANVLGLIQEVIAETGIQPEHLELEITEGTLMHDPENVISYLEQLKGLGVELSIDDFGTGYSSLNYLKRFPVDTLKIDRSFVIDIADNPKDEAIAVTIITLAHAMGMTVLAEGVEYERQGDLLRNLGCDIIQGFLFSHPMPFEHAAEFIRTGVRMPM